MRLLISHHGRTDGTFAERLSSAMRDLGVQPRIENLKAICGDKNPEKIGREMRRRFDGVIAVLSKTYCKDDWLYSELIHAVAIDQDSRGAFLFPLLRSPCSVPPPIRERVTDFRNRQFEDAFADLAAKFRRPKTLFVIMRFGDYAQDQFFNNAVRPVMTAMGFEVTRIDEVHDAGSINDQVLAHIESASIVYSDLSGQRPNCYFETGYALALGKELILSLRKGEDIHFDLSGRRHIVYEYEHPDDLARQLALFLKEGLERLAGLPARPAVPALRGAP